MFLKFWHKFKKAQRARALSEKPQVPTWDVLRARLREYLKHEKPEDFLNWDFIRYTMFHFAKPVELEYLKGTNDWPIWEKAIVETDVGNPPNNLNLIHQAYSLARYFEYYNGISEIKKIRSIAEIGGGYGCMRRLVHELGFRGRYVIYDLPEFLELQKYYLNRLNLPTVFTNVPEEVDGELLIALWSVSEMPLEVRDLVLKNARHYLIAYQDDFEGIDNDAYFLNFMRRNNGWREVISHLPNSRYLMW